MAEPHSLIGRTMSPRIVSSIVYVRPSGYDELYLVNLK
jgi:hypothetical protein